MTTPAIAIKDEVRLLIDVQIETLTSWNFYYRSNSWQKLLIAPAIPKYCSFATRHSPVFSDPRTWDKKVTVNPDENAVVNFVLSEK